jgi:hypothetical protein
MKSVAIRTLYFAPVAAWFAISSAAAAEPKSQYGGFSSDTEGQQAYHDYIHSLEMIPVEAVTELQQASKAIPVESNIAITPEQEANLRAWLYDFLVAFSASGSDSLAAAFYLREGVDNPDKIQRIKEQLESGPSAEEMAMAKAQQKMLKEAGIEMSIPIPEPIPNAGDTPLDILKTQHRLNLDMKGCDYCFDKVSFFDSKYRVSEFQGVYGNYADHLKTRGLLPVHYKASYPLGIKEHEKALQGQWVAAQFMFIAEEPEECADFEKGPMRYPFFVRLVWSPEKAMWRLAEIVMPNDAPVQFSFL